MTVRIPAKLRKELVARAEERRISLDRLVGEALRWYVHMDRSLIDELNAWQQIRDEALQLSEESPT